MKKKGTRAERELFHWFYDNGFMPCRIAGSGSTPLPSPDLVVGNGKKHYAIECKVLKSNIKYLYPEEMAELIEFAAKFGAEPWIAIKFDYKGWFFLKPEDTGRTKNGYYSISLELAKQKGLNLTAFLQLQ